MAAVTRKTNETNIELSLSRGAGESAVSSGIGFFDHMLAAFFLHGGFTARLRVEGDLDVDGHHTAEDTGLALGAALRELLDENPRVERFADCHVPMDEAIAFCAADLGGRAFLAFDAVFPQERIGGYDACLTREFFRALCSAARITLHIKASGGNAHHITEAVFKAAGRAVGKALTPAAVLPSTKGVL
jgi:imidazoleglycerol-phosphate dehydratase